MIRRLTFAFVLAAVSSYAFATEGDPYSDTTSGNDFDRIGCLIRCIELGNATKICEYICG